MKICIFPETIPPPPRLINFTLNDTNYTSIFLIDQLNAFISRSILLNRVLSLVWKRKKGKAN